MSSSSNSYLIVLLLLISKCIASANILPSEKNHSHIFEIQLVDEHIKFNLEPRKSEVYKNVPVWVLNFNGLNYKGIIGRNTLICEDPAMGATLIPVGDNLNADTCNANFYTGVFGTGVKQHIIGIGEKQRKKSKRKKNKNINIQITVSDVVQKRGVFGYREISPNETSNHRRHRSVEKKKWSNLNIKILVVVDYALYNTLGIDHEYIVEYMNVFWSAVDLKYRNISQPNINLEITGLIIVEEKNILNYTDNCEYDKYEGTVDMSLALDNFGEVKQYLTNISEYNAIVTLIGLFGVCDDNECYGLTFRKCVCDPRLNGVIITDDGKYFGINNAVHEIGHLLGLRHDGYDGDDDNKFEYKICGFSNEKPGIHTVMLPENYGGFDEFGWSQCSLNYFHSLESDEEISCIGK